MTNVAVSAPTRPVIGFPGLLLFFLLLAFPNGVYGRVMAYVGEFGWVDGIYSTFGVSALIWLGMWMACDLAARSEPTPASRRDLTVLGLAALGVLFPVSGGAWVAMTIVSLYVLRTTPHASSLYRAFWVVLALCFSGFWSRQFFVFFMDDILRVDTVLVARLTGTPSFENLIYAADGKTTLQVQAGCSSFNNMSLAFLGWILACSHYGLRGFWRSALFISLSAVAVVSINTLRIGIIAWRPDLYDLAHGSFGANVANLLTTLVIGGISIAGARK